MSHKAAKRQKLELVFNNKERVEFLTGFSKRKQARKKAARDTAEKQFKEEISRIRKEKREKLKQRLEDVSSVRRANGVELAQIVRNESEREKILDLPQHVVTITSAEEIDLTKCDDTVYLGSDLQSCDVEVVDTETQNDLKIDQEKSGGKETDEKQSKASQRKSADRVASLAKKAQMFQSKRKRHKNAETGRMSKSQKKFLRKKSKHKNRSRH